MYFPADRFGPETRRRVLEVIHRYWPGEVIGRDDRIVEMNLARMQLLIAVRPGTQPPSPEPRRGRGRGRQGHPPLERRPGRSADACGRRDERRSACCASTAALCPRRTRRTSTPSTAAGDLARLEDLPADDGLAFTLYTPADDESADRRLKVFRTGQSVSLARALPIFTQMGIEVLDERPYEIELADGNATWIYDFGLRMPPGVALDDDRAANMVDALTLLWRDEIERDGFNALVVRRRNDLVAGERDPRVRQVPAADGHDVQPGLPRARARRQSAARRRAGRAVRGALRPGPGRRNSTDDIDGPDRGAARHRWPAWTRTGSSARSGP